MSAAIGRELKWRRKQEAGIAALIGVVAAWIAGMIAVPFLFMQTPVNSWYLKAMMTAAPPVKGFDHVFLVTADERTNVEKFEPLDVQDRTGIGFGNGQRTRPLIGRLCHRLAASGCRVVALDGYYVSDARPGTGDDEALIGGAKALEHAGIDWVMATPEWEDRITSFPRVVEESGAARGAIWLHADPGGWYVQGALERNQRVIPSFSLVASAVYRHPGKRFAFLFDRHGFGLFVTAIRKDGTEPLTDPKPVAMSRVIMGDAPEVSQALDNSDDRYTSADRISLLALPSFPPEDVLRAAHADAGDVMAMSDAELRERCRNKVVVIANTHSDFRAEEWASTPDGRLLPKSFGHALAIETLLQGEPTVRALDRYMELATTFLAGVVGAWAGLNWARRPGKAVLAAAAGTALLVGGSVLVLATTGLLCNMIVPVLALLLALGIALLTPRVKRASSTRARVASV